MDASTARYVARARVLPSDVQWMLWNSGDVITRSNLARCENLDPALSVLMVDDDLRVLAAWARAPFARPADLLARAAARPDLDEHARLALVSQPDLDPSCLRALGMPGSVVVLGALLDRDDLPPEVRHDLAPAYASLLSVSATGVDGASMTPAVRLRLGDDPSTWAAILAVVGPDQAPLLGQVPHVDVPEVQDALIDAIRRVLDAPGTGGSRSARNLALRALRQVICAPALTAHARYVAGLLVATTAPDAGQLLAERGMTDFRAVQSRCACVPYVSVDASDVHLADVRALLDAGPVVLDPLVVAREVLAHEDVLDPSVVSMALSRVMPVPLRALLAQVEAGLAGSTDAPMRLASLVERTSVGMIDALSDPLPVVRELARRGTNLVSGMSGTLSPEALAVVVEEYVPVTGLLPYLDAVTALSAEIDSWPDESREVAWALLGEWTGSLGDLRRAAGVL